VLEHSSFWYFRNSEIPKELKLSFTAENMRRQRLRRAPLRYPASHVLCGEKKIRHEIISANTKNTSMNQQQVVTTDINMLNGNWIRTDGGYTIRIAEVHEDGKLDAGYFNPKSIHVVLARWMSNNGGLKLYIELRDVNYPGSNYNLSYLKDKDMLSGEYYQAVEGNRYKVEFSRTK
jgi:hypothetical protein